MNGKELGKYRVLAPIGKGGMASVFVGEHTLLGHKVAIKVLQKRHLDNAAIERRFFNEAKVIASIRHPNIVEIFDFGSSDDGQAYIVMELLTGQTLRNRIRRGIMPERQSVLFMRQLASALAEAHAMGVIHRDLKPDNVFIIEDEEVELGERIKLLDFGIAKRIDPELALDASEQTATGILVGTPAYMSPEQCKGLGHIDGRSDIYSLGVVLYRMLTNQLPFEASGTGELIGKHLFVEPPSPREINDEISVGLEEIVLRCLQKEPQQRFANMGELVNAFGALISSDSTRFVRASLPAERPDTGSDSRSDSHSDPKSDPLRSSSSDLLVRLPVGVPAAQETSATTLRTATGENLSPAYADDKDFRGRNWPLWTALGCVAAMLIGIVALSGSSGGEEASVDAKRAAGEGASAKTVERSVSKLPTTAGTSPATSAANLAASKAEAKAAEPVPPAVGTKSANAAVVKPLPPMAEADGPARDPSTEQTDQTSSPRKARKNNRRAKAAAAAKRERDREAAFKRRRDAARQAELRATKTAKAAKAAKAAEAPPPKKKKKKTFDDVETPMLY